MQESEHKASPITHAQKKLNGSSYGSPPFGPTPLGRLATRRIGTVCQSLALVRQRRVAIAPRCRRQQVFWRAGGRQDRRRKAGLCGLLGIEVVTLGHQRLSSCAATRYEATNANSTHGFSQCVGPDHGAPIQVGSVIKALSGTSTQSWCPQRTR
jgi:hypothetical protein